MSTSTTAGQPHGDFLNLAEAVAAGPQKAKAKKGQKILLDVSVPEGTSEEAMIEVLKSKIAKRNFRNTEVQMSEVIDCFPWDGAVATANVFAREYGWVEATPIPGFFGDEPPQLISIATGVHTKVQVPWGRFKLPDLRGWIATQHVFDGHRVKFVLTAQIKRDGEERLKEIFAAIREECQTASIYRGKAVKIRFRDDDGDSVSLPVPEFIDTSGIDPKGLIFASDVQQAIEVSLFTPITRFADCIANHIPLKRGVLLGGTYGTGKTLAATVAAKLAEDAKITYVYVTHAAELAQAIQFAKQYQSPACVVFCEDIDRAVSGARSAEMDDILNVLDGIDTKGSNIITVLTSNDMTKINPAMLRPGRIDQVVDVRAPDADAAMKLVRLYARGLVGPAVDLSVVGAELAGQIPAVIAEVVTRAKLTELAKNASGTILDRITPASLLEAAQTMKFQVELLRKNGETPVVEHPSLQSIVADGVMLAMTETIPLANSAQRGTLATVTHINNKVDAIVKVLKEANAD